MDSTSKKAKEIFISLAGKVPAEEWDAHLQRACGGDEGLRECVQALLRAHAEPRHFLEHSPLDVALTADRRVPVAERPGQTIGRYKLLQEIGEGGFGVVYMAEQREPVRRKVALKIIKPGMDTKQVIARFETEEQALAMMDHPNIAKVHDAGATESGRPYFVMELVHGTPLTEYCDQNELTTDQRLELFVSVCQAVHHAHQKGIIHRDIKPTNVMVTLHDGVPVPKIIDFGIAKATDQHLTERTVFTSYGQMVGTPLYMSPEQAELSGLDIDTRSDIYSLGVLLYELLTGSTPFDGERIRKAGHDEMRRMIREEEPPRPSDKISTLGATATTISARRKTGPAKLSHLLRGELDWIVMKALEKDRTRRYEMASDLGQDVQRYLRDEPVAACPPSSAYRFHKFVRRNRPKVVAIATVAFSLVAVLVCGIVLFAVAFRKEKALRQGAQQSQQRAQQSEMEARRMAYASDIMLASRAWRDGDLQQFVGLLNQHRPTGGEPDLRGFEWYYLWQLPRAGHFELKGHQGAVYVTCCSPDALLLATAGEDAAVRVFDLDSLQVRTTIETGQGEVNGIAFATDGQRIASAGDDGTVRVWDLETGRQVRRLEAHPGAAYSVLYTPDGKLMVSCGDDPVIRLWDRHSGELQGELKGHGRAVEAIALSPNGRVLASASGDKTAMLWDLDSRTQVRTLTGHDHRLTSIAFSPGGKWVATGSIDKTVSVWDATTGALASMVRHLDGVQCLAFGPNGRWLAAGDRGGAIRVWPETTWTLPDWSFGSVGQVRWCGISPDGRTVAAATWEHLLLRDLQTREIRELTLADPNILGRFRDDDDGVYPNKICAFSRTGRTLACLTEIHCADPSAPTGWRLKTRLDGDHRELVCLAFSPDGRTLATGQMDATISLWDTQTGHCRAKLEGHGSGVVTAVAYSPDGQKLASVGQDGRVIVWDTEGSHKVVFDGHLDQVTAVAFSPDGTHLASGSLDRSLRLWNLQTGEAAGTLMGHKRAINDVAFSPDGLRLASSAAGLGQTTRIWDVESRQLWRAYSGNATFVSFLSDGKTIMSGGYDDVIRFWDLGAEQLPRNRASKVLKLHAGRVYSLASQPKGGRLVSSGQDGNVIVSNLSLSLREREVDHASDFGFASNGRELAIASPGGVYLVNTASASVTAALPCDEGHWVSIAVAPDGRLLAAANSLGTICVWDLPTRSQQARWNVSDLSEFIHSDHLAFSPDGRRLAVVTLSKQGDAVRLFNTATGELVHAFPAQAPRAVAFSPDGARLVVGSQNDLLVWDLARRQIVRTLHGHTSTINGIAFSPDGRLVASAGNGRTVRMWDADTGQLHFVLNGHRDDVESVAFSPDGRSLATADYGGSLKVWHVSTGRELLELIDQPTPLDEVAFSADGKRLAYRLDGNVRIIHVPDFDSPSGDHSVTAK